MKIIQPINKNALIVATISFLLGTLLLLFFLISQSNIVFDIGLFYVIIASVLNIIVFIGLITNAIINYQYYQENLTTIILVILNIPITIGYTIIIINNPFLKYF
ncbi:hypothetical protein ATE84_1889 [Aquimarina sp. MAR_2010_214]|uniref:hypothetical protein n=1 Tax=Aquimarina sp. MAR_2010_214 TaxID=1250026 RepID=UPI000C701937|nr:hypothetical protein [Aquimarina sp. MAR_2010_214]PKV49851.1 hypothetical protein ATE84_1889 [Aquimarina sp. MAR_2010_214]